MNKKIVFLWIAVFLLSMFSSTATISSMIYENTFNSSTDWVKTFTGTCAIATSGGFTGMRINPGTTGLCYKDITDKSTGNVTATFEIKTVGNDPDGGHTGLGFDNADTPAFDGSVVIQSSNAVNMRTHIVGAVDTIFSQTASEVSKFSYFIDLDKDYAAIYKNGTLIKNSTGMTENLLSFGFMQGGDADGADYYVKNLKICVPTKYLGDCEVAVPLLNFTIKAKDQQTNTSISSFYAIINGTKYNTTDGTLETPYPKTQGYVFNITIYSQDYKTIVYTNYDTSTNLTTILTPTITFNLTQDLNVLEQSTTTFAINFSHTENVSDINAELVWNNTPYAATKTNYSVNKKYFTKTLTMPDLPVNAQVQFYWNYTYTRADSTTGIKNTSKFTQTIQSINIQNCTSGNITDVFTIYNEETPTIKLPATFQTIISYWVEDPTNKLNYSFGATGKTNYSICLSTNETVKSDIFISYTTSTGFTHRYYLVNYTLNRSIRTYNNIYNFNGTTGVSQLRGTLKNQNDFTDYSGVYAVLQRLYIDENTWRTVQMDLTGDFGSIVFNIIENDVDYRMLFYDENYNLLRQTDKLKFACTSGICDLTILLDPYAATQVTPNLTIKSTFNNVSRIYTINWTDPTSRTSSVRLIVTKEFYDRATTICDVSRTGSAGNLTCNTTGYSGNLQARVYASASPAKPVFFEVIELVRQLLGNALNDRVQQSFWAFLIVLGTVGVGMFSPAASMISLTIGSALVYSFGLLPLMNLGVTITISLILLIAAYLLKD